MAARRTTQTNSNSQSDVSISDVLASMSSRIDRAETDFIGHLEKVEDRLDQIVDLTKTVAVLQQQTVQQTDHITEVRTQLRDNAQKFDNAIVRIHVRLDELTTQQRDKMDVYSKEIKQEVEKIKGKSDTTDKELKAWLNRGWGAWVVFALLIGAVNTSFYRWIDSLEKERSTVSQQLTAAANVIERHSQQIDSTSVMLKEQQQQTRVLDQSVTDINHQLELMRNGSGRVPPQQNNGYPRTYR